jgi:hypothetical protein
MIGARKNAPVAGLLLGFFFGPFGLLFSALIRGDYVECQFCKERMKFDATICPHCRKDAPPKPDNRPGSSKPIPAPDAKKWDATTGIDG